MGCSPQIVGSLLTAEEFHQLHAMWAAGELQGA
jgi:hypothetical protein